TGTVPAPHVVDAVALAGMDQPARDAEWEKWEGVLIEVQDITISEGVDQIGDDPTFLEFVVDGDLHIDNSLAEIPAANAVAIGECVNSVVGMGDYFFSWKILPRSTAEVDISGTDCGGAPVVTVAQVQAGGVSGPVKLEDVVVTAVSFNGVNLWVQDAVASAAGQGIYVYRGNASTPDVAPEIVTGAVIDVVGNATEFDFNITVGDGGLTQIASPTLTFKSAPAGLPTPVTGVTIADLNATVTGEPYEGVLVQLTNVEVTNVNAAQFQFTLSQGANSIVVDRTIYQHTPVMGDCYATFTGIFGTNTFDDYLNLLPRAAGDITAGGVCN
ncbi:MAG: hypothetical protein R2939_11860, partial [Kofleriaceae bacterium]